MTNQHPLTDKIIDSISPLPPLKHLCEGERCFATQSARWGADWQLEQVLRWLRTTQWYLAPSTMADLLEEAMRPQQQQEEQQ